MVKAVLTFQFYRIRTTTDANSIQCSGRPTHDAVRKSNRATRLPAQSCKEESLLESAQICNVCAMPLFSTEVGKRHPGFCRECDHSGMTRWCNNLTSLGSDKVATGIETFNPSVQTNPSVSTSTPTLFTFPEGSAKAYIPDLSYWR